MDLWEVDYDVVKTGLYNEGFEFSSKYSYYKKPQSSPVELATSLISVDTKGKRSLKQILALGLSALGYWAQENPDTTISSIVMCAPSVREAEKIVECGKKLGLTPEEEKAALTPEDKE